MPFKKGQSGNPKGRPPVGTSFAELLRSRMPAERKADVLLAIGYGVISTSCDPLWAATLEQHMREASPRDRLRAIEIDLNYSEGKPKESHELTGPSGGPIQIIEKLIPGPSRKSLE